MTLPALLLLLGFQCAAKDEGGDGGGDAGGGDGGGGSGTDGGGDGGDGGETDCDDPPVGEAPTGPACLSGTLVCGGEISGTTNGGDADLAGDTYQSWYCTIATANDYKGPERAYAFTHPGTGTVRFNLTTPCDDLDMMVVRWEDEGDCPQPGYSVRECEDAISGSPRTTTVWHNEVSRYLILIDGDDSAGAPFTLSATCP